MWFNPIMIWILRSTFHALFSKNTLAITYTGRKSGKTITVPVNYLRDGDTLKITSLRSRTWWRNLRQGAPLQVRLQGKDEPAVGRVFETEQEVEAALTDFFCQAPHTAKYYGLQLTANRQPEAGGIHELAEKMVVIHLKLQGV